MAYRRNFVLGSCLRVIVVCALSLSGAQSSPSEIFAESDWDQPIKNAEPDVSRGRALYTMCAGCHGRAAEGDRSLHAPNLTGLGPDYTTLELSLFRSGLRGNNRDKYGFIMIGIARALPGRRGLRDVSAYIDSLPGVVQTSSVSVQKSRGRLLYESCTLCHGTDGQGNKSEGGPPLRGRDSDYLAAQLRNFRAGIRGAEVADVGGQRMRQAVRILQDDSAIRDVVAFISGR
jgi:cytochrome c oxidase subunit 2